MTRFTVIHPESPRVRTSRFSATCECGCTICAEWRSDQPGVFKQRIGGACDVRDNCTGRSADFIIGASTFWHDLKLRVSKWRMR